eukprot:5679893-Prymnesium_polylepis.1
MSPSQSLTTLTPRPAKGSESKSRLAVEMRLPSAGATDGGGPPTRGGHMCLLPSQRSVVAKKCGLCCGDVENRPDARVVEVLERKKDRYDRKDMPGAVHQWMKSATTVRASAS